jgi:hypothetical protein
MILMGYILVKFLRRVINHGNSPFSALVLQPEHCPGIAYMLINPDFITSFRSTLLYINGDLVHGWRNQRCKPFIKFFPVSIIIAYYGMRYKNKGTMRSTNKREGN